MIAYTCVSLRACVSKCVDVRLSVVGTVRSTFIQLSQSPKYLYSIIPIHNMSYRTRQCNKIPAINVNHDFFKNTFFPSTIVEWNKLDWKIKNSESIETF